MKLSEIDAIDSEIKNIQNDLNAKAPGFVIDRIRGSVGKKRLKHSELTAVEFDKMFPQAKVQKVDPSKGDPIVTGGGRGYDAPGHKAQINGKTVYFSFRQSLQGQGQDQETGVVAPKSKSLTPVKLNLQSSYKGLDSLYKDIQTQLQQRFKGPILEILLHILKNAMNRDNQKPLPSNLSNILSNGSIFKPINQDFGETIAPFLVGKKNDAVDFPVGNEPIIDLKLPGMDLAVKSLTGSGNAFTKIKELFDQFEATIDPKDTKTKARFGIYKIFSQKVAGQTVADQIIYGSNFAQNPEMVELTRRTGKMKITNSEQLKKALGKVLMTKAGKPVSYNNFIKFLKAVGGVSGKVFGVPRGASSTGPRMYEQDPLEYATLTFTYMLGKGLENMVVHGSDKEAYADILNKIMRQVNASAGYVNISKDGIASIDIKPFKDLKFRFDYHAYTSNPGNNRPGFAIVR